MDERLNEVRRKINEDFMREIGKWIVGYKEEKKQIAICLFAGSPRLITHVLLESMPGLGKTKLANAIAKTIGGEFKRIQGTPDLQPGDITGVPIWNIAERRFETVKGPIFANIVLCDEVNRIPGRTQSALLEGMQEGAVTIEKTTYPLPELFMVLATENPIDHEGTYPLLEPQKDRFMMHLRFDYLSEDDELTIAERESQEEVEPTINKIFEVSEVLEIRSLIRKAVKIDERQLKYVVKLVRATRPKASPSPDIRKNGKYGGSVRPIKALVAASRVHAFLRGGDYVLPDDIVAVAMPILRHRIIINPMATDGDTLDFVDKLVEDAIDAVGKGSKNGK